MNSFYVPKSLPVRNVVGKFSSTFSIDEVLLNLLIKNMMMKKKQMIQGLDNNFKDMSTSR